MTSLPVFRAFGRDVALETTGDSFLEEDSRWRLRDIYEPALALWPLPATGHAIDLGAGFGAFALPFALAFPGWRVTCLEPEAAAFAALRANIERLDLGARVSAERLAVVPGARGAAPLIRSRKRPAFLSADIPHWQGGGLAEALPAVPPEALVARAPDLLKLTAPGHESAILAAFDGALPRFLLGEAWTDPPRSQLAGGDTRVHLPFAGSPWRLQTAPGGRRRGLDVVVAMYNSAATIADCVSSVLDGAPADLRVLVVDDGSTDGSASTLRDSFADHPQVHLLQKENGGCASARNWGRMHSDAEHLAFIDADDMVEPGFYPEVLEIARYSGRPMAQGGFRPFRDGPDGPLPAAPPEDVSHLPRRPFGKAEVFDIPWPEVVTGQPTIWRRVYRRDFLDARAIWFPDHIRAFDDQIFQLVTGYHAGLIPARDDVHYLYRQHAGQDIRQGDERAHYSLEMYRLVLRRAVTEGWSDFGPVVTSYFSTLAWSHAGLRDDLRGDFLRGAAELWTYMRRVWGPGIDRAARPDLLPEAFARHAAQMERQLAGLGDGYVFGWLDGPALHVDMLRADRRMRA
ncbi:MAG: glycosyltransferase [Rhodobacteraceae bacterium]|nr:glycosyltransferase [Paracoccaceae bacterium]MBR9819608.1 glycosyltransferase [Paracoccaceae bacterium]